MRFTFIILLILTGGITAPSQLPNAIAFTGNDRVYVIRADGSGQTAISSPTAGTQRPRWSRDGRKILFLTGFPCSFTPSIIWKMNADGSNLTSVDLSLTDYAPSEAVFSPNADRIAYGGLDCFDLDPIIFVGDANGGNGLFVTYGGGGQLYHSLDWSPVDERLVYSEGRWRPQHPSGIRSINTNGSGRIELTTATQGNNFDEVWSPDGSKIAFVSDRDGNWEIYTMNSDGSNQVRITNSTAGDLEPTWSPDGTRLAFSSNRNGPYNIHVVNADGTNTIQLTQNAFDSTSPHWNPDRSPRRAPFDFDGDGKTDIGIKRANTGAVEWWMRNSSDESVSAASFGLASDVIAPADFTGDGKTDVAVFRFSDGSWHIVRSENSTYFSVPFGSTGDAPLPRDYDDDGKADLAIYRATTNTWWIQRSTAGLMTARFGTVEDVAVPADYDGDGKADIAVFRGSDGTWWIDGTTAGLFVVTFGSYDDRPVPGDYTGDGKTDAAVWRPDDGNWYVRRSEDGSYFAFPWGSPGDVLAPGDYDGDGRWDAGVFRAGTWYINRTTGAPLITLFGMSGDQPIPNAYIR